MVPEQGIDMARRDLLKLMAGGSIAASAPLVIKPARAMDSATYDVVIVGAGMAGLYAAKTLLQRGYRVRVLEASARHGGRIYSRTLGNTRIEMGAEEHYLARDNPIYDAVANEYGQDVYTQDAVTDGPDDAQKPLGIVPKTRETQKC